MPLRDERWSLGWSAQHLLLLTATPHMGKEYPYYALWRLLDPDVLSTPEAFERFPPDRRSEHFIRRSKEEMVFLDGRPMYPKRLSDTLAFDLETGEPSEESLYRETTDYLRYGYNRARLLNREAARLATSVFQRRLASSTWALLRSFERRIEKLDRLITDIQDGRLTPEQLAAAQQNPGDDVFEEKTADDEQARDGREENEMAEDSLLQGVVASSIVELLTEREEVARLLALARAVHGKSRGAKFERLRELVGSPRFLHEKLIIFTEHRDTLEFLVQSLGGLGYTDRIARIHGGMDYRERGEEVERFRLPAEQGGARFLVCTDAAGEGINLQFCWIMVNWDVPWNPARLEQRMGRIHRYGQRHDPVVIVNLIAPKTREGKVLKVLLDKLERIRAELRSDKVFDCIGRLFEDVSLRHYMELAVTSDADAVAEKLDGRLTTEQVEALAERERRLYGPGGDVARELPRVRGDMEREIGLRLLPGFVRNYLAGVAPLLGMDIDGDIDGIFTLRAARAGALDPLLDVLEQYPQSVRDRFSVSRPRGDDAIWLHPGEPVFDRIRASAAERLSPDGRRGAVFVDPTVRQPYLFHMAVISIVRTADPELPDLARTEVLERRLVCIRQAPDGEIAACPVEHLLLLKGGQGLPSPAQQLAVSAGGRLAAAEGWILERAAREAAVARRKALIDDLPRREEFLVRGFDSREAELASARAVQAEKAREGNARAAEALEEIKQEQRRIAARRDVSLAAIQREPELICPGPVEFIAHALVAPSEDPAAIEQHDARVEKVAMMAARVFEEAAGATVLDVHAPDLARRAGLADNPGFDLLSVRDDGSTRSIEVKGRSGTGDIEITANEWARACNMRERYWLYAVYDCGTPNPRLLRVRDPFGQLLARAKGSMLLTASRVMEASEETP